MRRTGKLTNQEKERLVYKKNDTKPQFSNLQIWYAFLEHIQKGDRLNNFPPLE